MKTCTKCGIEKPLSEFTKKKKSRDGINWWCKECLVETSREYRNNNLEKVRRTREQWKKNNPEQRRAERHRRRVRKNNNGVFVILTKEFKKIYLSPCFVCGSTENLTQDHIIPISRGGKHSIGNLMTLCHSCNASKGSKTLMEWRLAQTRNALVE